VSCVSAFCGAEDPRYSDHRDVCFVTLLALWSDDEWACRVGALVGFTGFIPHWLLKCIFKNVFLKKSSSRLVRG
jgi:hypothetical protein